MTTIYLIRHARSVGNAAQQIQGWLDLPLDDYGRKQARLLGERFHHKLVTTVYASPLIRAAETAQAIALARGLEVKYDERLREYHMGAWTGLTNREIEEMMPPHRIDEWHGHDHVAPGAETGLDMRQRIDAFLADVLARHPGEIVAVVCHGGTLGAFISSILGLPPIRRQPFTFGNASVTKVVYEHGRWRVRTLNDRCHLRGLAVESE